MTRWRFAQKFEHTQFLQSGKVDSKMTQNYVSGTRNFLIPVIMKILVCSDYIKKGGYLEVKSATDLENGTIPVFRDFSNDQNGHQL